MKMYASAMLNKYGLRSHQLCKCLSEGVEATSSYRKDECLGELVGEIMPPDFRNDGWAFDLGREDILDTNRQPTVVCQVYPCYRGNWVRKINIRAKQTRASR